MSKKNKMKENSSIKNQQKREIIRVKKVIETGQRKE